MRSALLLAFTTLMIGAIAGGWTVGWIQARITTHWAGVSSAAEASTTVWTLERLRSGNTTKAVELLESKLDGALIGLGASLSSTPESRRDPALIKTLQSAREYRARFPRKTENPEIDEAVARVFALLDRKTEH